jgi:hypothetical protein
MCRVCTITWNIKWQGVMEWNGWKITSIKHWLSFDVQTSEFIFVHNTTREQNRVHNLPIHCLSFMCVCTCTTPRFYVYALFFVVFKCSRLAGSIILLCSQFVHPAKFMLYFKLPMNMFNGVFYCMRAWLQILYWNRHKFCSK